MPRMEARPVPERASRRAVARLPLSVDLRYLFIVIVGTARAGSRSGGGASAPFRSAVVEASRDAPEEGGSRVERRSRGPANERSGCSSRGRRQMKTVREMGGKRSRRPIAVTPVFFRFFRPTRRKSRSHSLVDRSRFTQGNPLFHAWNQMWSASRRLAPPGSPRRGIRPGKRARPGRRHRKPPDFTTHGGRRFHPWTRRPDIRRRPGDRP